MGKYRLILLFFLAAPSILLVSFYLLLGSNLSTAAASTAHVLSYSTSDPGSNHKSASAVTIHLRSGDSRPILINQYLHRYSSPLEPYAQYMVDISDRYHLDYRLLPAIAQQESNLCKKIPPDSHNCWGYGIYGNLVTKFDSFPEAIETVARALKRDYLDKGLDSPEKIMAKYTPPSVPIGGPWAIAVSQFLSDLE